MPGDKKKQKNKKTKQNIKQKQYCNKFNKYFKKWSRSPPKKKKKRERRGEGKGKKKEPSSQPEHLALKVARRKAFKRTV